MTADDESDEVPRPCRHWPSPARRPRRTLPRRPAPGLTGSPPPGTVDGHPGGEHPKLCGQRPRVVNGPAAGVLQAQSDASRPVEEHRKGRRMRDESSTQWLSTTKPSTMPVRRSRYAREAPAAVAAAKATPACPDMNTAASFSAPGERGHALARG